MSQYRKKYCQIRDALPGVALGEAVFTDDNKIILGEGTILTSDLIEKLNIWGIQSVILLEPIESKSNVESVIQPQQKFYDQYNDTVAILEQAFENMRYFKEVPLNQMKELSESSVESLMNSIGVINHLSMVRNKDNYTFQHSVDVSILAGILGKWLGYTGQKLKDIVLAGLLHDVGKTQIPLKILNKPVSLTDAEMAVMQKHTVYGYNLIKNSDEIPLEIKYSVLQHHERTNGTGYPFKLKSEQIHPYAKIIAIADTFDAMTSDRVYRKKLTPFVVVEMLIKDMFQKFDPTICTTFLNNVRDYFIGNVVRLNDGRSAEVVYMGQFMASRPVLKTEDGMFIDLEKQKNLCITQIIES